MGNTHSIQHSTIGVMKMRIEGKVTIELIDKKTGKVVERKTGHNVLLGLGSQALLKAIMGTVDYTAWNKLNIFDTAKNYIKSITGTLGSISLGTGYYYVQLAAQDNSDDTYTTRYFGLHYNAVNVYANNLLAYNYGSNVTKNSTQNLNVTWEIRISYYSPP